MMESQSVFERVSEQPFATQPARPERVRPQVERVSAARDDPGAIVPASGDLLRVQATLLLLVLGALLLYFSAHVGSDPAFLAGSTSLLGAVFVYRHTRARLLARIERRGLARGLAPERARVESVAQTDELLSALGRGEPCEHLVRCAPAHEAPARDGHTNSVSAPATAAE